LIGASQRDIGLPCSLQRMQTPLYGKIPGLMKN
jgi:hypothetical protein